MFSSKIQDLTSPRELARFPIPGVLSGSEPSVQLRATIALDFVPGIDPLHSQLGSLVPNLIFFMYMWKRAHTPWTCHVSWCMCRGQMLTSHVNPHLLRQGLLPTLCLPHWLASKLLSASHLIIGTLGLQTDSSMPDLVCVWGFNFRFSCLQRKYFSHWATFPSPLIPF